MRPLSSIALGLALLQNPAAFTPAEQAQRALICSAPAAPAVPSSLTRLPMEVTNNHVYLTVCAAQRPLDFLLDTGAAQSSMDLGTAKALGAELKRAFQVRGAGAGTVAGAALGGQVVTIAGTPIVATLNSAIDFAALAPREGRPIEGVLGAEFITKYVVAIDYLNAELRLYDPRTFRYQGAGTSVPLTFADYHPHVEAEIKLADGDLIKGRFVVDVGSSLALSLTRPFVDKHRLRERTGRTIARRSGGGVGGPATATIGRVAALRIGGVDIAAPVTHMFGESAGVFTENANWVGNIGGDILRRFTVYFDYERRRMILEPHARTLEPFETDMSGAVYVVGTGPSQLLVEYVLAESPAASAGLQAGDVIVAIEDQPIHPRSLPELRRRLRRESETVTLTVARGQLRQTITFTTRRLV